MKLSRPYTLVAGAALLGAAVTIAAWPTEEARVPDRTLGHAVKVSEVRRVAETRHVRFAGVARAADRARLAFSIPGRIASRLVDTGDVVTQGQTVALLDASEYQLAARAAASRLTELEVRLEQAERDEARVRQLSAAKAATAEEVEQMATATAALRAAAESARLRAADAERMLREARLSAPFAGTVTASLLQAGEWANPGAPVVELSGSTSLEVEVQVPETVVRHLELGHQLRVTLPFADVVTDGRVATLGRAAGQPGSLFPVVVTLASHPALIPGSAVELELALAMAPALGVPPEAVLNPGSSTPSVFRVREQRAEKVPVVLGPLAGDLVVVQASLNDGDRVVVSGHTVLAHGDRVEVR